MAVDISGLGYFLPIFGFVFVFVIVYALLQNTKILGGNKWIDLIIGFIIAVIFATMSSVEEYVETVTPWFVVLVIALFFILIIVGMSQQKIGDVIGSKFVWVFIILLILVFLIAATNVFPSAWLDIRHFIVTESRVVGGILLLIIAGLASWVLVKK